MRAESLAALKVVRKDEKMVVYLVVGLAALLADRWDVMMAVLMVE